MVKPKDEKDIPNKPAITLYEIGVSEGDGISTEIRAECNFPKQLKDAIRRHAPDQHVVVVLAHDEEEFSKASRKLFVNVEKIDGNVRLGAAYRPGTTVDLYLSVIANGEVVRSTSKHFGTVTAFTVCSRLEHAAELGGEFVATWLSRLAY